MKTKNLLLSLTFCLVGTSCIGTTSPVTAGVIITDNQISGRVLDTNGCEVRLINNNNPLASAQTLQLSRGGQFSFNHLDSGSYSVQIVQKNGLGGFVSQNVQITQADSIVGAASASSQSIQLGDLAQQNFISIPLRLNDLSAKVYAYGQEIPNQSGLAFVPYLPLSQNNYVKIVQNGQVQSLDLEYVAHQLQVNTNLASINHQDFTTIYDLGQKASYHTLRVGPREWLLEPIAIQNSSFAGKCYNGSTSCTGEGLFFEGINTIPLASFAGTTQICPSGYTIPTLEDIQDLISSLGDKALVARSLRSKDWANFKAQDPFGFGFTPSGWFNNQSKAELKGQLGAFWLSTIDSNGKQLMAVIDNQSDSIKIIPSELTGARALVRCIRNNNTPMAP